MGKTIKLDREAYEILKSRKLEGESFSDVIKKEILIWKSAAELDAFLAGKIGRAKRQRTPKKHESAR